MKTRRPAGVKQNLGNHARGVAAQAIPQARRAGTTAVNGVMVGVQGAREWAAPRLEQAADAVTGTVAPKVSAALRSTAKQIRPSRQRKSGLRRLLDWRLLLGVGAALVAAGTAAAVTMRRRYQNATTDAKESAEMSADIPNQMDGNGEQMTDQSQASSFHR